MPNLPSRGIKPTTPSGKKLSAYGLTLTVPETASSEEKPNENGLSMTFIRTAGAGHELPLFVVSFVEQAERTLAEETYFQETLLLSSLKSDIFVSRTPEYWPVGDATNDACLMTWTHREQKTDGSEVVTDNAALYITDGVGGYWRVLVRTDQGDLPESGPVWQSLLSATVAPK